MLTAITAIYLASTALCLLLYIPMGRRERYASSQEIFMVMLICVIPLVNTACLFWSAVDLIQAVFERMANDR